jgi:hypothetical protein
MVPTPPMITNNTRKAMGVGRAIKWTAVRTALGMRSTEGRAIKWTTVRTALSMSKGEGTNTT